MIKHSHAKRLFFRFCAGAVFLAAVLFISAAERGFQTIGESRENSRLEGYVTDRQIKLASPWTGMDESALYQCMKKAHDGGNVTAAFIGGSITWGRVSAGTSDDSVNEKLSYADYFSKWWRERFPNAALEVVNAGISATDSYLGVHRVQKDVLDKNPDLVIVEFAVNDQKTALYKQSYENLVRKLLKAGSHPAVLLLFMSKANGESCQLQQSQIGKHYHLPMISYKNVMKDMLRQGIYTMAELSGDGIHPSALGHAVTGELITKYLEGICQKAPVQEIQETPALPDCITSEKYKNARVVSCRDLEIKNMGTFRAVKKSNFFFGNLECSSGNGNLEFTVTCKNLGFLYVREKSGNGGQFDVYIDGKKTSEMNADDREARINYPAASPCYSSDKISTHTVHITKKQNSTGGRLILYAVLVSD